MSDQRRLTPTSTDLAMLRFFRPSLLSWSGVLARVNWAWAFVAVASLCCIALQSNVYLNHDVGWVLYSSGLMLDGQVLSRDIIEPNPPLIYFLSALPALAAKIIGVQSATAFRFYMVGLALVCLALCWRALQGYGDRHETFPSRAFIAIAALDWLILPGREFGQREHLALTLTTPYLLVTAAQLSNTYQSRGLRFACGLLAGIGFSLKPYFLIVPLFTEIYSLIATRPIRWMPRLELIAMASIGGLYLISIPIFAPNYLSDVIPMFRLVYWGFNSSPIVVIVQILPDLLLLTPLLALVWHNSGRHKHIQVLLGVATFGFLAAYAIQMKGYAYHAYAFQGLMLLWLLVNVSELPRSSTSSIATKGSLFWLSMGVVSLVLPLSMDGARVRSWYGEANMTSGALGRQTTDIINLVNHYAHGRYFAAFSTHPYPGFPVSNQSLAKWGSRTNSHFVIPAIAQLRQSDPNHLRPGIEQLAHEFLLADFKRFDPTVVLVDARSQRHALQDPSFDILNFYLEDARFQQIWRQYTELTPLHGFRVFIKSTTLGE